MTSGMIKSSDGRYQIKAENAGFRIVDTVTGKTALIGNNPSNNTMGLECDWINVHNNISAPYINVNKYVSADDIMIAKTAGASTKTSLRDILKSGGLI